MMSNRVWRFLFATTVLGLAIAAAQPARAGLVLTINSYTTDQLTVTISGTFDLNTVGDSPGYLAIKNDWVHNVGVHTELFSSEPLVTFNSILIGGVAPSIFVQEGTSQWMDDVFFLNPNGADQPFLAGTPVSGVLQLSGAGNFNPADASTLNLVSGFVRPEEYEDWARLEATATNANTAAPEPCSVVLVLAGLIGSGAVWQRRRAA